MKTNFKLKNQLIAFSYVLLVAVFFVGCKGAPKDEVTDSEKMIVYYIETDVKEGYKYEYRVSDGENEVGFKLYSNRIFLLGDTLRLAK